MSPQASSAVSWGPAATWPSCGNPSNSSLSSAPPPAPSSSATRRRSCRGRPRRSDRFSKGSRYTKASYLELLGVLYAVFRLAKTKGDLVLETHVETPSESPLFQQFPEFSKDHHAVEFLCDYLRLLTLGTSNAHEVEAVIDNELDVHHEELHAVSGAVQTMADALPALGIVAAVLGVIHTMGSITEPPEVLGHLIGGALVGTFAGILASYGFVAPMGQSLTSTFNAEARYLVCIKVALLGHMQGYAPQVSVEFARKDLEQRRETHVYRSRGDDQQPRK